MYNKSKTILIVLVVSLLASMAMAQDVNWGGGNNGGGYMGGGYMGGGYNGGNGNFTNDQTYFDTATIETMSGRITSVGRLFLQEGTNNNTGAGMNYVFTADNGDKFYAMFAPFWFMDQQDMEIDEGLNLKITGSIVAPHNSYLQKYDYVIVTEVVYNGVTLVLRDSEGIPAWFTDGAGGGNFGNGGSFGGNSGGGYNFCGFGSYDSSNGNLGGGYYNSPGFSSYDVVTVTAKVTDVRYRTNGQGVDIGLELLIEDSEGNKHLVFVAPVYYLETINFNVNKGDRIVVTGANGNRYLVVQTIKLDGKTFTFRDSNGRGAWIIN